MVKLWRALEPMGVQWWMSETSGTAPTFFGEGRDRNGNPNPGAFNLANQIHNALVYGNASAWVYWCFGGHFKSASESSAKEALVNGDKPTKKYYASKQFYKFIRPGAIRVDAGPDGKNGLQISAFLHEKNKTLTIVLLNYDTKEVAISIGLKSAPAVVGFQTYRTTESEDFKKLDDSAAVGGKVKLVLAAQSITTLYGESTVAAAVPAVQQPNGPAASSTMAPPARTRRP